MCLEERFDEVFFAVRIILIVRFQVGNPKSLRAGAHDTPTLVGVGVPSWKKTKVACAVSSTCHTYTPNM